MVIFCYVYRDIIIILIFSQPWGRYLFSEDILDNKKEYDVFLSYANQDSQYVEDILLSGLERPEKTEEKPPDEKSDDKTLSVDTLNQLSVTNLFFHDIGIGNFTRYAGFRSKNL